MERINDLVVKNCQFIEAQRAWSCVKQEREVIPEVRGSTPRFLVVQYGARHGYAIPAAFQRAGALAAVYTDLTATDRTGRLLTHLAGAHSRIGGALSRRAPPAELEPAVQTFSAAYLAGEVLRLASRGSGVSDRSERLAKALMERCMVLRGTSGATHIYTMLGEGGEFVRRAKNAGLGVVGDVYIALSAEQIVAAEAERFTDWIDEPPRKRGVEPLGERNSVLLTQSDLLVCPSEFVRDDLVERHGIEVERTVVVPYAVSPRWLSLATDPEPGRVLFAGSATIRKGIHHLAAAATLLRGVCRIRVAGSVSKTVRDHQRAADLTFLGHLSAKEMAAEFARADVFAFPSLAEGSASVTAEALGAGVPVVTTKAAGSIVRDGVDGILVPEGDPNLLAEAIHRIVSNRSIRKRMSQAARDRAREFTWDGFASSIIAVTRS